MSPSEQQHPSDERAALQRAVRATEQLCRHAGVQLPTEVAWEYDAAIAELNRLGLGSGELAAYRRHHPETGAAS